ncbi:MAG: DivIVA domain-containing protein [Bacilli bacterium]|nr:DivIVA domain-containing protein [Bacilli bacterium]
MEKFTRVPNGYNPSEVNQFLDQVINQVGVIIKESKAKDQKIRELESRLAETDNMREKLGQYQKMEQTLTKAIYMAQKTADQMRTMAYQERDTILEEAKNNANRIVNESLLKAEKTKDEADMLRRNVNVFKRRIRNIVEAQIEVIDELDKVEL